MTCHCELRQVADRRRLIGSVIARSPTKEGRPWQSGEERPHVGPDVIERSPAHAGQAEAIRGGWPTLTTTRQIASA